MAKSLQSHDLATFMDQSVAGWATFVSDHFNSVHWFWWFPVLFPVLILPQRTVEPFSVQDTARHSDASDHPYQTETGKT